MDQLTVDFHLNEALGDLQRLHREVNEKWEGFDEIDLQISLRHIIWHLVAAWKSRDIDFYENSLDGELFVKQGWPNGIEVRLDFSDQA